MIPFRKVRQILFNSKFAEYHLLNIVIMTVILAMFLLLQYNVVSFKCVYSEIGSSCKTCGLTTSFKDILNGNFNHIKPANGIIFIVFCSQLLIRPVISVLLYFTERKQLIRNADTISSLLLFGIFVYAVSAG